MGVGVVLRLEIEDSISDGRVAIAFNLFSFREGKRLAILQWEAGCKRSNATIAGQEAVVLDGVPGQDINRQIMIVRNGRLYQLTFVPASEDAGEVYARMEQLYQKVVDSLNFYDKER